MNSQIVNNQFYNSLNWWEANDHMIVFLRAESKIRLNYIHKSMPNLKGKTVLDLGCGAGFISLPLAEMGACVTAIDLSEEALRILQEKAQQKNLQNNIQIKQADILQELNLNQKYDLVLALDVLEHVFCPEKIIEQAFKYLKPNGLFIYHTLNRTFWCWLLYLQLVPRLIKNDPKNVHVHEFNIKPVEINAWLNKHNLQSQEQIGIHAPFGQKAIWELITQRKIISELNFEYTSNLALGYLGKARSGA